MVYVDELVDGRIGVHDDNQVEIKLDYGIDPGAARTRYQIETYVFAPRSLGIDRATYAADQFYADVQSYIRFKTPFVALADLTAPGGALAGLADLVPAGAPEWDSKEAAALRRELQLLGCLVRANTRDAVADLRDRFIQLLKSPAPVRASDLCGAVERLCLDLDAILTMLRGARPAFMKARRPAWLGELFEFADEYVSVSIEDQLTALLASFDADETMRVPLRPARQQLVARITTEQDHRRAAGYATVFDGPASRRTYVYRVSALKKFMSSVLFLEVRKGGDGHSIKQGVAGLAAGVAMLFSTLAALFSQRWFAMDSMPFVFALVVAYVFKDRIKEWLKVFLSARFSRHLYDFRSSIVGPRGIKLGRCRETFGFVDPKSIDASVLAARHADNHSAIEPATKPEVVMRYIKDIAIRGRRAQAVRDDFRELNDIIRFNVASFLARMDDPVRTVATYVRELGRVTEQACPKHYHLNIVLLFRGPDGARGLRRFRVVLDRGGIVGLDDVTLPGTASPAAARQSPATATVRATA